MGICSSSLRKSYIRIMRIFHRRQLVRMRGEHAEQFPGKLFKFAFLVYFMRLMRQERLVNQRCERSPGLGDRFVNVIGPDGDSVLFGFGLKIHVYGRWVMITLEP